MGCDGEVLGCSGCGNRSVVVVWSRQREIILSKISGPSVCKARRSSYIATFAVSEGCDSRMRHGSIVSVFVIDGSQSEGVMSIIARAKVRAHPEGRVGCASSRHDDITALTNTESDHVGSVWHDRHKIVGKNGHIVAINGEILNAFSAGIDKPKSVRLARMELELGKTGIRRAL